MKKSNLFENFEDLEFTEKELQTILLRKRVSLDYEKNLIERKLTHFVSVGSLISGDGQSWNSGSDKIDFTWLGKNWTNEGPKFAKKISKLGARLLKIHEAISTIEYDLNHIAKTLKARNSRILNKQYKSVKENLNEAMTYEKQMSAVYGIEFKTKAEFKLWCLKKEAAYKVERDKILTRLDRYENEKILITGITTTDNSNSFVEIEHSKRPGFNSMWTNQGPEFITKIIQLWERLYFVRGKIRAFKHRLEELKKLEKAQWRRDDKRFEKKNIIKLKESTIPNKNDIHYILHKIQSWGYELNRRTQKHDTPKQTAHEHRIQEYFNFWNRKLYDLLEPKEHEIRMRLAQVSWSIPVINLVGQYFQATIYGPKSEHINGKYKSKGQVLYVALCMAFKEKVIDEILKLYGHTAKSKNNQISEQTENIKDEVKSLFSKIRTTVYELNYRGRIINANKKGNLKRKAILDERYFKFREQLKRILETKQKEIIDMTDQKGIFLHQIDKNKWGWYNPHDGVAQDGTFSSCGSALMLGIQLVFPKVPDIEKYILSLFDINESLIQESSSEKNEVELIFRKLGAISAEQDHIQRKNVDTMGGLSNRLEKRRSELDNKNDQLIIQLEKYLEPKKELILNRLGDRDWIAKINGGTWTWYYKYNPLEKTWMESHTNTYYSVGEALLEGILFATKDFKEGQQFILDLFN